MKFKKNIQGTQSTQINHENLFKGKRLYTNLITEVTALHYGAQKDFRQVTLNHL